MNDNFSSEESDVEPDFGDNLQLQKTFLKRMQDKCAKYEKDIQNLSKEKKDRDTVLRQMQEEIQELQMDIQYKDLRIHKAITVCNEMQDKDKEERDSAFDHKEIEQRVEKHTPYSFTRYLNRLMFSKKSEFEGRIDKKKNFFQAVCVKYYKDDPTNEEFGHFVAQSYSLQVFGLSNDLKFRDLFDLCTAHWKIQNFEEYVLTDQDHHDLTLLYKIPIVQYMLQENNGAAVFILRPKNVRMKELMSTQKAAITLIPENEKQGKLQEDLKKVFALIKKVKPGCKTYEASQEESNNNDSPVDGTIFNFLVLISILVEALMLVALFSSALQPQDERELNKFNTSFQLPSYFSTMGEFFAILPNLIVGYNETTQKPLFNHFIPIGKKRIIMNKMLPTLCIPKVDCIYNDYFTSTNFDLTPLSNTTEEVEVYRQVPEEEQINIQGRGVSFDGNGFIYDAPLELSLKEANDLILNRLKYGRDGNYFGPNSRAIIFHSTYFEPNRHLIFERTLLFEFTSSNVIEIKDRKTFFKPNSDNEPEDASRFQIDLALLIITVAGYLINVILNVARARKVKEVIQLRNVLKYLIISLVVAYFVSIHNQPAQLIEEIIKDDSFITFYKYGESRQTATNCLTVAFFCHSLTMIRSLVFSSTINVFLNIFAQSYKDFLAFLLIFFSSFLGFSFVFWIAFGPYVDNLQQLTGTAFEIFQYFATVSIFQGNTLIITQLFIVNEFWAVILVIVMGFIIFIQLDALMMSLVQENVRRLFLKSKPAEGQKLPFREALDRVILKAKRLQAKVERLFGGLIKKKSSK